MPVLFWECKVNAFFWFSKFEAKKFQNSKLLFGDSDEPFSVTGCKGTLKRWDYQEKSG
jgi:hypothetical protein